MVKVECDGCKATYEVEERRIPAAGLKMKCAKCGKSLLVTKSLAGADKPTPATPMPAIVVAASASADADNDAAWLDFNLDLPDVTPKAVKPRAEPLAGRAPAPAPTPTPMPTPRGRAPLESFGDLDALVDLPASRQSAPPPLPAPVAASPAAPAPAPAARKGSAPGSADELNFGDLDLPTPVASDLPIAAMTGLPRPAAATPAAAAAPPMAPDLPAPVVADLPARPGAGREAAHRPPVRPARAETFGKLDLGLLPFPDDPPPEFRPPPGVGRGADLPSPRPAAGRPADLPSPRPAAGRPADLPAPAAPRAPPAKEAPARAPAAQPAQPAKEAPARAPAAQPATPAKEAIAAKEAPARAAAAPAAKEPPRAEPSSPGMPRRATPYTENIGRDALLAAMARTEALGIDAASPPSSRRATLDELDQKTVPREVDPFDFPLEESALPLPDASTGAFELSLEPIAPAAAPAKPATPAKPAAAAPSAGFELDLAAEPAAPAPAAPAPAAKGGSPFGGDRFAVPTDGDAAATASEAVGGDLSLESGALGLAKAGPNEPAAAKKKSADAAAEEEAEQADAEAQRRSKRTIIKLAAVGSVLLLGGASLTFLPDVGPFGWHLISDRLNASAHGAAFAELKKQVQDDLDLDTTATVTAALGKARAAQAQMPRNRTTAAYTAFVAYMKTIRFGRKTGEDAIGKQLLVFASTEPGEALDLALAAQALSEGKLDAARTTLGYLLKRAQNDVDVAALAGEIELAAGDKDKALAAWKRAVTVRKSARTLFGQARAEVLAGDLAAAEASARATIAASPKHASGIYLLASVASKRADGEAEAIDLLGKIMKDGEIKAAASERDRVDAASLLGEIHLARSRMSAADEAFKAALAIDPQAMRALIGSGELFYRSSRYSEALARFEAATRADPANIDAVVGTAKTILALERAKDAKDVLKKAKAASPQNAKSPKLAYWQGRVEETLGNKKEAEAAYNESITLGGSSPEVIDAYIALTYLLTSVGRPEDAAAKLNEASTKFPDKPALHKAKGDVALQTGRFEEAKTEFEAVLAREEDLGARFSLATALRRLRAFDEASAMLDKVEAADKEFPGLALERGLLFEETGKSDKALEMYAAALQKAPNDLDLKLRVGSAQVVAGQAKQAEAILQEVLKARPQSAEANHFLGRALLLRGKSPSDAMRYLDRAVEIDPNRAEYYIYVAWAANELSQSTRADAAINKALSLDKENGDAYWQRGILLQKQGASVDALKDLETALQKRPSRYEAYATMALCYQDLGRWPEAEEAFKKAIAQNDSVAEWHYRLGKIYMTRGNRAAAEVEMEKALEIIASSERPAPAWLFDAHFQVAELLRSSGQGAKAIDHYKEFLAKAPADNVYRADAEKALKGLGVPR